MSASGGVYAGAGVNDADVLFTTDDMSYYSLFSLHCIAGAVNVLVSLDGKTYTTAPLSLADLGATTTAPVIVTAAGRMYAFAGKYRHVRVMQNGATAASVVLKYGTPNN